MIGYRYSIAVVTNDIFTKEDGEFLVRNQALPPERIVPIETGIFFFLIILFFLFFSPSLFFFSSSLFLFNFFIITGGCPHAAIREDITANVVALEKLTLKFSPQILIVESGGDNLAANYSRELADCIFTFINFVTVVIPMNILKEIF